MTGRSSVPPLACLAALLVACGGRATSGSSQSSSGSGADTGNNADQGGASACVYPANADTLNAATGVGCSPESAGQTCQVSNGATVLPDGGVANGTETCTSLCGASEYELTCTSGSPNPNGIPDPDPSLGCTIIPIPTPSDALFYCCPCGG
ncbi:MAG: hypothetical protein ACLQVI_27330 [Polyangiaceae bacterium]